MAAKRTESPRSYGVGRTKQVRIRVTPDEKRRLETAAKLRGMSVSDFTRYVSLEAVPEQELAMAEQTLSELSELETSFYNLANTIRARHGMGGKKVE